MRNLHINGKEGRKLVVQVIVIAFFEMLTGAAARAATASACISAIDSSFGESEVLPKSSALLKCLAEHFVFANVLIGNGSASEAHSFFKMLLGHLGDVIAAVIDFHGSALKSKVDENSKQY